jgi:hypothetical protein
MVPKVMGFNFAVWETVSGARHGAASLQEGLREAIAEAARSRGLVLEYLYPVDFVVQLRKKLERRVDGCHE